VIKRFQLINYFIFRHHMTASVSRRKEKEQGRWQPLEPLVASVQNYPILYDMRHPEYRNSKKKDEVWESIAVYNSCMGRMLASSRVDSS
jgi:hypothetical protein